MLNASGNISSKITAALGSLGIQIDSRVSSIFDEQAKTHLINDSRIVQDGDIFCAVIGNEQDGKQYIDSAIANGAAMVIAQCQQQAQHGDISWQNSTCQTNDSEERKIKAESIPVIQFYQLAYHLFEIWPELVIYGICGFTNDRAGNETISHYWLEVEGLAIDITGDQYNLIDDVDLNSDIVGCRPFKPVCVAKIGKDVQYRLFDIVDRDRYVSGFPMVGEDFIELMKIGYSQLIGQELCL